MPQQTPFHPRTAALCSSYQWKDWAGYHAVCSYETVSEPEYHAVRLAAGLLDVTPLQKVEIEGPDAADFLAYVSARDVTRLKVGQVAYGCWCDGAGKVLDDGTITRRDETVFRLTSADPSYAWLLEHARGFDVTLRESADELGALALQGPAARRILEACCDGGGVGELGFFRHTRTQLAGVDIEVTRTGYTGDLGYELWIPADGALAVWDALTEAGRPHGLLPMGLDALDVCRIEAGFVLMGVDYFSARRCLVPAQTSTPYELGLGWTVHTKRGPFLGRDALRAEKRDGSKWALVGLVLDWDEIEALFAEHDLPPQLPAHAWRGGVPVYAEGRQVGQATSGTWSPVLKQNLALASVHKGHDTVGAQLEMEFTVEYQRRRVKATVTKTPFFDPERKRS